MCGITGFLDFKSKSNEIQLDGMVSTLNHRGPDDKGVELYQLPSCVIGLAQARLSIIDLSNGGHQPMNYKHFCIVFNGEIYNYAAIKDELIDLAHEFITQSDTEVILHAYEEWGAKAVDKFIGMFAIVLFDSKKQELIMITDRAGVKPLYYYWFDGLLMFSSELKAFHQHPGFIKSIDMAALELYFTYGYIPAPKCIFTNCFKLEAGNILTVDISKKDFTKTVYWNINDFYKKEKLIISYKDAKDQLKEKLHTACNYRMVADVPVGVFLSGGYDSTAVCAILQADRTEKLKTFTIGFEDGVNEAPFAKQTAAILGTDHSEFNCSTREAQAIIPTLSYFYDEPFADTSAIPTILVSQQAKKQVTVALSGDGGDEIFAGYESYKMLNSYLQQMDKVPGSLKSMVGSLFTLAEKCTPPFYGAIKHKLYGLSKSINKDKNKQSAILQSLMRSLPEVYNNHLFKQYQIYSNLDYVKKDNISGSRLETAMAADFEMYLSNNLLTKVDRATMSVGLEGREPLLDHHLIEFAVQLPFQYKFDDNGGKRILKDIVHDYIPSAIMSRPKTGFDLPIYKWLRTDLSYILEEYLSDDALKASGLFNVLFVSKMVNDFKRNKFHYTPFIWYMLMFQMWYKRWM